MPGPTAPTYYEHSKGIVPDRYDHFFKWVILNGAVVDDTGDVEAPVGFVSLVQIDSSDIFEYCNDKTTKVSTMLEDGVGTGWYVTRQDNNGLIWAMTYGTGTMAEEGARADFASAQSTYNYWCDNLGIDLDEAVANNPTNTEDDTPSYGGTGVWIDLDSGTWGTGKVVFVSPDELPDTDFYGMCNWLTSQADTEIIKLGRAFGVPMEPSKPVKSSKSSSGDWRKNLNDFVRANPEVRSFLEEQSKKNPSEKEK